MLQHLWSGPISNASVDVVQGGRSVEVRAVGVTKVHALGLAASFTCFFCYNYNHTWISFTLTLSFNHQGAAIDRILGEIVHNKGMKAPIDYVLCIGHFLQKVCFSWLKLLSVLLIVNIISMKVLEENRLGPHLFLS